MFRRRRRDNATDPSTDLPQDAARRSGDTAGEVGGEAGSEAAQESHEQSAAALDATAGAGEAAGLPARPNGPWDVSDVPENEMERLDLGGLRLAIPDGASVQLDVTPDGMVVPTMIVGEAAVQVSAFAAPRRTGIWAEVRAEIAQSLQEAGGSVAEAEGTFGTELHGEVPVELPDGSAGAAPARFVGVDGPRWFLRGLFTGEAVEPGGAPVLEDAFRATVVVRGTDAMAPRDPLPVSIPPDILQAAGAAGEQPDANGETPPDGLPALDPFERGPEITELR